MALYDDQAVYMRGLVEFLKKWRAGHILDAEEAPMAESIPGVHSDPEILGGTPVFIGTRVPVRALLDYLEHDRALAEFLDDFPTVDRALALGVLEHMKRVVSHAPAPR